MSEIETANATETRRDDQPAEETFEADHRVILGQETIDGTVIDGQARLPQVNAPPSDAHRDNSGAPGRGHHSEFPAWSSSDSSDSLPPSETLRNTRVNAGATTDADVQRERRLERDPAKSGSTLEQSPSHFVSWLASPAPQIYASPLTYPELAPQPTSEPFPEGFQPYVPAAPASQLDSLHPQPQSNTHLLRPGFQPYVPVVSASQRLPSISYAAPRSAPQGRWGYEHYVQSPYHGARGPIGRRKEVYESHDPFRKWNNPKAKPSRVPYNPYAPAYSSDTNTGPVFPWHGQAGPTPFIPPLRSTDDFPRPPIKRYQPHPIVSNPPYRQGTYDSRTSHEPHVPMQDPPWWSQAPTTAARPPRQGTYNSQQSNDLLYGSEYIPSGPEQGTDWNILPGQSAGTVGNTPDAQQVLDSIGSPDHQGRPSPRPHSGLGIESPQYPPTSPAYSPATAGYSPTAARYSPTSPAYSPASPTAPTLPTDANLPASHPASATSSGAHSSVASFTHSAASPTTPTQAPSNGDRVSVSTKHSYNPPDASTFSSSPIIPYPPVSMLSSSQDPSDVEKLNSPLRSARRGIGRLFPAFLRSWTQRASRWRRRASSESPLYSLGEEHESTSASDENGFMSAVVEFITRKVPTDLYLVFLLFLPSFYFSRVARLFEEAELAMPEIEQMAIRTSLQAQNFLDEQVPGGQDVFPPQWIRLKSTWEHFIDSLIREWKTLNVISALLLSAILTILQIGDAANDYLTRYTALLSLICSLVSLLFGCIYIIRFATMRKTYKAAEWAMEAQESGTSTWWNVFILLALPSIWLTWSILLYVVCIMSYIWRTAANTQEAPPPLSDLTVLKIRIGITILLGFALVFACFILATFRRYGTAMDRKWAARINTWRLVNMYPSEDPPGGSTWESPYPYSYPGGSVYSSLPKDIHREERYVEKPQVRFRSGESYLPSMSVPSDASAKIPPSWGEYHRNGEALNTRKRSSGSFDIYQLHEPPTRRSYQLFEPSTERPDWDAPVVSPTQASTLLPLSPSRIDSERPSQKSLSLPRSSPPASLYHSPEIDKSSINNMEPFVTPTSSLSLQLSGSQPPHVADVEPPSGLATSVYGEPHRPLGHLDVDRQFTENEALPTDHILPDPVEASSGKPARQQLDVKFSQIEDTAPTIPDDRASPKDQEVMTSKESKSSLEIPTHSSPLIDTGPERA